MFSTKTKQWGNSIGVIIPSRIAKKINLKPDEELIVSIEKKSSPLKELFGSLKMTEPTSKIIKESRKQLESKYLK